MSSSSARHLFFLLNLFLSIPKPILFHKNTMEISEVTVSLQVVIGLCKRKETAALKIKAAVSNGRVKLSALRRLFSFAVVRQKYFYLFSV